MHTKLPIRTGFLAVIAVALILQWFNLHLAQAPIESVDPKPLSSAAEQAEAGQMASTKTTQTKHSAPRHRAREQVTEQAQGSAIEQFAQAADLAPAQVVDMQAAYFCDLAVQVRTRCESIPRTQEQMEFCLKSMGYYTNSRHCGYQP